MKLSVIFPVHNQFALSRVSVRQALQKLSGKHDVEFIILDNGSKEPFTYTDPYEQPRDGHIEFRILRSEQNIGVYPTFWWGLKEATGDVLAFLHSDLVVAEGGWDQRVLGAFMADPKLGMLGFIGSNEIDGSGGRGLGTCSNFQGGMYVIQSDNGVTSWTGSPAEPHGRRIVGMEPAAVEDGCAMVFRRSCLEAIAPRADFPPHHFYDRLLSCEVREKGWTMATLGIGCDHISGQTVNQEKGYDDMAREWCEAHGLTMDGVHNWDSVVYREAERQWLKEYRDEKHLVPCRV